MVTPKTAVQAFEVSGEMSVYSCQVLHAELGQYFRKTDGDCCLDLQQVTEMDGAGLQLVLWLRRLAQQAGRRFRITHCSDAAAGALRLGGLAAVLEEAGA